MTNGIKLGQKYIFAYPWQFTMFPDYIQHRGKIVEVVSEADEESIGDPTILPQYIVVASDGWVGQADPSELLPIPSDYVEPNYVD